MAGGLCRETFVTKEPAESPNDRNDRAIRVASAWYAQRLPQMDILLLTNDAENRRKALEQGLKAMSIQVRHTCSVLQGLCHDSAAMIMR